MNTKSYLKFLVLLLFLSPNLFAQTKSDENCVKELKGFILDTQEYLINSKENSTFDIIFYPGFTYRVGLCTKNPKIKLEFKLIDEKGNEQFKSDILYGFYHDFRFETIFHGKIQVKTKENDSQPAQIIIGYKKNKN